MPCKEVTLDDNIWIIGIKAAVRRTIKIGRFWRPTTSADKNRP